MKVLSCIPPSLCLLPSLRWVLDNLLLVMLLLDVLDSPVLQILDCCLSINMPLSFHLRKEAGLRVNLIWRDHHDL